MLLYLRFNALQDSESRDGSAHDGKPNKLFFFFFPVVVLLSTLGRQDRACEPGEQSQENREIEEETQVVYDDYRTDTRFPLARRARPVQLDQMLEDLKNAPGRATAPEAHRNPSTTYEATCKNGLQPCPAAACRSTSEQSQACRRQEGRLRAGEHPAAGSARV